MSFVMERSPKVFSKASEEVIRDHYLVQLNGQYEGSATGETFNGAGKSDILIREGNANLFIAECKVWHGQAHFVQAISQLFSYLTWRDTKSAIIVFNRNQIPQRLFGPSRKRWRLTLTINEVQLPKAILACAQFSGALTTRIAKLL